jgi:geranyl-CoA carboxylase beta subunit
LLPRERLNLLLDPGAPFLELASLAGYKLHDDKDGSGPAAADRRHRLCPACASGGGQQQRDQGRHHFPQRPEENPAPATDRHGKQTAGDHPGRKRRRQPQLRGGDFRRRRAQLCQSGADVGHGLPQITVVHGSATAGGAYQPGLSDYVVVVRGKAKLFLAGPPLLKAATGEVATDEELGGAEMHAQIAGTAEYLAENDADGVRQVREIVSLLPWNDHCRLRQHGRTGSRCTHRRTARADPGRPEKPYDVREIIARIADGSTFSSSRASSTQTVCGHLQIQGRACG